MNSLHRALAVIGVVALATAAALVPVILSSDFAEERGLTATFMVIGGVGFVGAGLFAWARRPDNRIGAIMVFTGFAWFASFLGTSGNAEIFTAGVLVSNLFSAGVIHLLLAFPSGDLRSRLDRWVVGASYVVTALGGIPIALFGNTGFDDQCEGCPRSVLVIDDNAGIFDGYVVGLSIVGVVLLLVVVGALVRRFVEAIPSERRVSFPVYLSGGFMVAALTGALTAGLFSESDSLGLTLFTIASVAFVLLPLVFLGGLIRTRMVSAGAMTQVLDSLADQPARGALRDTLAGAIGDDSLAVSYWLPSRSEWVDAKGQRVDEPRERRGRGLRPVVHNGEHVASLDYDASVVADDEMVAAVGGAVGLAMENERLDAELRARLEDLHTSRARLVEAGIAERRRLERDLHDGAQQRLVSLALSLRMAQGKLEDDPDAARALLTGASQELELALEELRELARGIHPAVLSDRGLDAALAGLAARAPLPVDVQSEMNGEMPEAIESAAYFVVSEALTNVAKYANAGKASVHLEHSQGFVSVAVRDDGVGGADPTGGSGLRGLGDRVSALDGRLEIDSREGRGTTIRARFPCA